MNRKGYLKKLLQVSPEKIKGNKYLLTNTLKKDQIKALNDIKNKVKMKNSEIQKQAKSKSTKKFSIDDLDNDFIDEINFRSGKVNMDDIGKEILDEINFQSGMLDSIEIEEIFKIINSNIQKIDTDDMIDIIYEIGEARKF